MKKQKMLVCAVALVLTPWMTGISHADLMIDDFSDPVGERVIIIHNSDLDPTLLKTSSGGGSVLGGERDLLLDVLGVSKATSFSGSIGAGVFEFGSVGDPGTVAVLQYDGLDADVPGHPASLINAEGLGGVAPKDTVYGVVLAGQAFAVTEAVLAREKIVNAVVADAPVALLFEPETGFVRAVERRLQGRVLLLVPEPGEDPRVLFRDAFSNALHSHDELASLRVDRAFWYAWSRSHPESRVIAD